MQTNSITPSHGEIHEAALSLVLGVAVGDALGVPAEGRARGDLHVTGMLSGGSHGQAAGAWSDDTSLTLALADSVRDGSVDIALFARNCQAWLLEGRYTPGGTAFGIGRTTMRAIERLAQGVEPEQAGGSSERDNGNGSLMRVAPLVLALLGERDPRRRYEAVRAVSAVTHAHPWSVCACCLQIQMLDALAHGADPAGAYTILRREFAAYAPFFDQDTLGRYARVLQDDIRLLAMSDIRSSAFVVDTLEAGLWCLMTTESFSGAVLKAVNLGLDTDTTAAVTGALAGLYYGWQAIPGAWIQSLYAHQGISEVQDVVRRFVEGLKGPEAKLDMS